MTRYTWTHTGRTGARTYQDPAHDIVARIERDEDGVWSWSVNRRTQAAWIAAGYAQRLAFARTEAEAAIAKATGTHTPDCDLVVYRDGAHVCDCGAA